MRGLERNQLLHDIGHLLTGYIGSASFLEAVLDVIQTLKQQSQQQTSSTNTTTTKNVVRYVCDPVLGDSGKFYVPKELVELFRSKVIPQADVVTPNQFEAEQLTGIVIKHIDDVKNVCEILHTMGPKLVIITSADCLEDTNSDSNIAIYASLRSDDKSQQQQHQQLWRIITPRLPGRYTGTGDLLAALLLGHTALEPNNLPNAFEKVMNTMYAVIKRSLELSKSTSPADNTSTTSISNSDNQQQPLGLMLIQCKDIIENPPIEFHPQLIQ